MTARIYTTAPQQERNAINDLKREDARAWTPVEIDHTPRVRRGKIVGPCERLLTPGYVITDRVRPASKRVKRYVGSIRPDELARLKELHGREINRPIAGRRLQVGDVVIVKKGPFSQMQATVVETCRHRARLTTFLFGKDCECWSSIDHLERANTCGK
jgi:transcription antitermination factor NusG